MKLILFFLLLSIAVYPQKDSLNNNELYFNFGISSNINNNLNSEIASSNEIFTNGSCGLEYYFHRSKISIEANRMFYVELGSMNNNPISVIKQLSQLGINFWPIPSRFYIGTFHSWASFGAGPLYAGKGNKITHFPERGAGLKIGYVFKNRITISIQSHYVYDSYNGVKIGPDIENTYLCLLYKFCKK